jgi:hypothetical protein
MGKGKRLLLWALKVECCEQNLTRYIYLGADGALDKVGHFIRRP